MRGKQGDIIMLTNFANKSNERQTLISLLLMPTLAFKKKDYVGEDKIKLNLDQSYKVENERIN